MLNTVFNKLKSLKLLANKIKYVKQILVLMYKIIFSKGKSFSMKNKERI